MSQAFGRSVGLAARRDQGGHDDHADGDTDQQAEQELQHRADSLGPVVKGTISICHANA